MSTLATLVVVTVFNAIPFSGVAGQPVTGQRIVDFDATGRCVAGDYSVTVDWGDGTRESISVVKPIQHSPGHCSFSAQGSHTYPEAGLYSVSAEICPASGDPCLSPAIPGTATIISPPTPPAAAPEGAVQPRREPAPAP